MHDTRTNISINISICCRRSCFHYALRMDGGYSHAVLESSSWASTDFVLWAVPSRAPASHKLLSASKNEAHFARSLFSIAEVFHFLTPVPVISSTFTLKITSCFQCAIVASRTFNCRCARHFWVCCSHAAAIPLTTDSKICSLFDSL